MEWFSKFWNSHGERVVFAGAALFMAGVYGFLPEMPGEAKTVYIGVMMLCFNKARGNGKQP